MEYVFTTHIDSLDNFRKEFGETLFEKMRLKMGTHTMNTCYHKLPHTVV